MNTSEPPIIIQHREQLAELLTEAAEIEHNLMCCYLYAAWSLKSRDEDCQSPIEAQAVERWRSIISSVAIDEMAHLVNANNLLVAIGGRPHLGRPNFPIASGYHPADLVVALHPFNRSTIDHFVCLERPEGVDVADGDEYSHTAQYHRATSPTVLMPSAQDYATVGHLYRGIRAGLAELSERIGERGLFMGDASLQLSAVDTGLEGVVAIDGLASALQAVDNIVIQGEGNSSDPEHSHYRSFCLVRDELSEHLSANPNFQPTRPVVKNPVQRCPPIANGRAWVQHPEAARVLDFSNALYNLMLRVVGTAYEPISPAAKKALLGQGIRWMRLLGQTSDRLTKLPFETGAAQNAGVSFAITRHLRTIPAVHAKAVLAERTNELAHGARALGDVDSWFIRVASELDQSAELIRIHTTVDTQVNAAVHAPPAAAAPSAPTAATAPVPMPASVEVAVGSKLDIHFDGKRCIHSRQCVLGAPGVFLANTPGEWIRPDAMDAEDLAAIARRCPSGAITYKRKDGHPDESPAPVNTAHLRENGPYAFAAELEIENYAARQRATLCRCGASKCKPFCDGSHNDVGFTATGEPPSQGLVTLEQRGGPLIIRPEVDGPLTVEGNLEICAGTGRTILRSTRTRLCRCGGSGKKPLCDGTHRKIGFQTSDSTEAMDTPDATKLD